MKLRSNLKIGAALLVIALLGFSPPALRAQEAAPAPVHVAGNRTVTLTATADGTPPFTYQWHRNGVVLPGETKAQLIITDPKATGLFHCVISNSAGSTATPPVRLANTTQADAGDVTVTRKQKP